jgi:hypothetical protein
MACTACLVCFINTVNGCSKKISLKTGTGSRHIINLEQSFWRLSLSMNELNNLVFVNGKPFHPSALEHSSLLDSFVSYEENEEL